jgi:putative transposase
VLFQEAQSVDAETVAEVQTKMRRRVLCALAQRGLLEREDAEAMDGWEHAGGFSLDTSVRVEAHDRTGLEGLLRYCARPAFALERLT